MAFDASTGIVDIVESMHRTVQRVPGPLGPKPTDSTRGITGLVYRTVRGSMRLIGTGLDRALAPLAELLPEGESTPTRDAYLSVVNGVYGDYLARTGNPLALDMVLRYRGRRIDVSDPAGSLAAAGLAVAHGQGPGARPRPVHERPAVAAQRPRSRRGARARTRVYAALPALQHRAEHRGQRAALATLLESLLEAWPVRSKTS